MLLIIVLTNVLLLKYNSIKKNDSQYVLSQNYTLVKRFTAAIYNLKTYKRPTLLHVSYIVLFRPKWYFKSIVICLP